MTNKLELLALARHLNAQSVYIREPSARLSGWQPVIMFMLSNREGFRIPSTFSNTLDEVRSYTNNGEHLLKNCDVPKGWTKLYEAMT